MKRNYSLGILSAILFFSCFSLQAQNKAQVEEIKKNYNLEELQKLQQKFKAEQEFKKAEALRLAQVNGWPIKYVDEKGSTHELVSITDSGQPLYYSTFDFAAARSTRTDWLHNGGGLGLNIEGQGMVAHVWDEGIARTTHQEYDGIGGNDRYTVGDGSTPGLRHPHSAHVTGTIISSGVVFNAKGMAPQARAVGYNWDNDVTEATGAVMNGMLLSNHSYGVPVDNITQDWAFGAYIAESRVWDELTYNAPFFLPVMAAGNDGNNNTGNSVPLENNPLFDKLTTMQVSKNSMVVANGQDASIDSDGNLISVIRNSGSSEGPTDDLRIKPDIMGNGSGLNSTLHNSNDAYDISSGTSMASPNVMGSLLLLQQYYNQVNGEFMRAATLKGLALHTTDDVGLVGPDAQHGWGLMNTKRAAETITNNGLQSWIQERQLEQGETYTITVKSDGTNPLQASISWTDLPGTINNGTANLSTPVLVNDLDVQVTQNTDTFQPWLLTGVQSNTKGDNLVDPYERVDIDGASGEYTITVTHKGTLADGPQAFTLIVTGVESDFAFNTVTPDLVVCSDTTADYTFNYQQIGSVTTNFSVDNLPAGATANFSSPSLNANGDTTLTIDNLENVPAGTYEIDIVGDSGSETEIRSIGLRVYHPDFDDDPMVAAYPVDQATAIPFSNITLRWDLNLNAESYDVEISDNPSFTNILASGTVTDLNFQTPELQNNTVYYWRVQPSNRCAVGDFKVFSFQTGLEDCTNTYSATDFNNATIFDAANTTAFVPIDISDNLVINRLIVQADVTHRSVEDVTVFIQEPAALGSDNIILLDGACDTTDDIFNVTFDDTGGAVVCNTTSPAITGTIAPVQSLGSMASESSSGRWFFAVTDNIMFDGGSIDAASITVCSAVSNNATLPNFANNTIDVAANGSYTIQTSDIEVTTASETSSQQIYTLVVAPERGSLQRAGTPFAVGDTFTQEEIDNGTIDYVNTQTAIFTDSFKVDIINGTNGWLPNQTVNVSANVVSANSFELNNFLLFPNPSSGFITIRFETRTNSTVGVEVFDLQGRAILTKRYDADQLIFEERVELGNLANGIYLVRVSQGDRTTTRNVIVSQ